MPKIIYINPKKKALISLVLTIFIIFSALYAYDKYNPQYTPVFAAEIKNTNVWLDLIKNVFGVANSTGILDESFLDKILSGIAQTDITEPKRMMALQIIATAGKEDWYNTEPENEEILIPIPQEDKQIEKVPPVEKPINGKPLVGIYCTHNAETYALTDKVEKLEGKNGGVMKAANKLKEALEEEGVGAVLDDTIHDYPNWAKSYSNSLITAKKLLKEYPSIQIMIDIHRDAKPSRESSVAKINSEKVAKVSFIVGSDTRLNHPNWRKNWAYANFLAEKMEKRYPGLLKTVRVQSGRYNQHLNPHSILIEVGSTENSTEEAEKSMELFAEILAESIATQR